MKKIVFLLAVLVLFACSKKVDNVIDSPVLAKIGDRVITEKEFMERAEYTIRPPYVKQNSYIHKKMMLNSLIAEKLVALEADSTILAQNERFNQFVQGRKEQTMRQVFFQNNMYAKVDIDEKERKTIYDRAGREYDIHFISTPDERFSNELARQVNENGKSLDDVIHLMAGTDSLQIPQRTVTFHPEENWQVLEALYNKDVKKGDVIGPVVIEDENLWMQVNGWTEKVAVASHDIQNRWTDVTQHITFREAVKIYNEYVGKLMKGKRVDFDRDTFMALANAIGPIYFPEKDAQQNLLKQNMWGKKMPQEGLADSVSMKLGDLKDQPLLTYNGEVWTVGDLDRELMLHPLQFRKKNFRQGEFGNQLKLAIVDLIKDKEITADAYKQNLDEHPYVVARTNMWKDAFLATFLRNQWLEEKGLLQDFDENYMHVIETELNPIVDSLQTKYSNIIEINTDLFEDLRVTNIDMFAVYADQPYPVIVPSFPVLTSDPWLDYGSKLTE